MSYYRSAGYQPGPSYANIQWGGEPQYSGVQESPASRYGYSSSRVPSARTAGYTTRPGYGYIPIRLETASSSSRHHPSSSSRSRQHSSSRSRSSSREKETKRRNRTTIPENRFSTFLTRGTDLFDYDPEPQPGARSNRSKSTKKSSGSGKKKSSSSSGFWSSLKATFGSKSKSKKKKKSSGGRGNRNSYASMDFMCAGDPGGDMFLMDPRQIARSHLEGRPVADRRRRR